MPALINDEQDFFSNPQINRFDALLDKDNQELTSDDYIFMVKYVFTHLTQADKTGEDKPLLKKQLTILAQWAQEKIDQVFEGEIPSDEKFTDLVALVGTDDQRKLLNIRKKELIESGIPHRAAADTQSKKKTAKKNKAATKSELGLDAIVYDSKKLSKLTAQELLDIADRIENVTNEKQKKRMQSTFRYFIIQKLDNPKRLEQKKAGIKALAERFGTTKQRVAFGVAKAPDTRAKSKPHSEETIDVPKKSKEKSGKTPWYRRLAAQIILPLTFVVGAVAAVTGISKAFGTDNAPDNKDTAPKTEVKAKAVTPAKKAAKTIHFDQVRTAQAKTQKVVQAKQKKLSDEDKICVKRTADFLKDIAHKHKMSVEDAQAKLNHFVDNLDLPQGISPERMGYLTSIHALFPNSEFGIIANKMFDGETVHVSKDDISKLNQSFSKNGPFGHKNNKFNSTLQVMKQAKDQVK